MKKICIVATVPFALNVFMKPHVAMLAKQYEITLVTNGIEFDVESMLNQNVRFVHIDLMRSISLWLDFIALIQLLILFRKERFDVVHSLTPKAGLLSMVSAYFAGVPNRIHTFTGQVWSIRKSIPRLFLKALDKCIAKFATHLLTDSFTQRQFLIDEHIVIQNKIQVLANGSVCGVNVQRFKPSPSKYQQMRNELSIPRNAFVFLYLGRLNKEKGIQDLAVSFKSIAKTYPLTHLLVVGPDEGGMDIMLKLILDGCSNQFHRVGYANNPEDYMACSDILCLPSYREGFGSVIIEAAATGIPSVASNIYGLIDAVKDGETGILHQAKNIEELTQAMLIFLNDRELCEEMSKKAIARAQNLFAEAMVVDAMDDFYHKVLN